MDSFGDTLNDLLKSFKRDLRKSVKIFVIPEAFRPVGLLRDKLF